MQPLTASHKMTYSQKRVMRKLKTHRTKLNSIIDTAEALFAKQDYESTSVDQITSALGIAKGTFYLYFYSKEELLQAIALRAQEILILNLTNLERSDDKKTDPLEQLFLAYLEYSEKYPIYFKIHNRFFECKSVVPDNTKYSIQLISNEAIILSLLNSTIQSNYPQDVNATRMLTALLHETLMMLLSRYSFERLDEGKTEKYGGLVETFYELINNYLTRR